MRAVGVHVERAAFVRVEQLGGVVDEVKVGSGRGLPIVTQVEQGRHEILPGLLELIGKVVDREEINDLGSGREAGTAVVVWSRNSAVASQV